MEYGTAWPTPGDRRCPPTQRDGRVQIKYNEFRKIANEPLIFHKLHRLDSSATFM